MKLLDKNTPCSGPNHKAERLFQEGRQELEGLKRAQQWRTDEFSRQESQFTVNELTAQIKELQDKVNSMNDSREFQDVEPA